ncbi:MAG: hypothetical protein ACRERD_23930 [Candidatus Binatia bacterium]
MKIYERYLFELKRLPGVTDIGLGAGGIIVHTDNPAALPAEVEGLPIIPYPLRQPIEPQVHSTQPLPPIAGMPHEKAAEIVSRRREELMHLPGVYTVGIGGKGIIVGLIIYSKERKIPPQALQKATAAIPPVIEGLPTDIQPLAVLPPPPGVIILRDDGTREQADSCPVGFTEVVDLTWRFCTAGGSVAIPPLMVPPIAGISYEEALKIVDRHQEELMRLPGVQSVGLGAEGIVVGTDNPSVVPSEVEGLPVKTVPSLGSAGGLSHSQHTPIRPLLFPLPVSLSLGSLIRIR